MRPDYGSGKGELVVNKPVSNRNPREDNLRPAAALPGSVFMTYPTLDGSSMERRPGARSMAMRPPSQSQSRTHTVDSGYGTWHWPQNDASCTQPSTAGSLERPASRARQSSSNFRKPGSRQACGMRGGPYAQRQQQLAGWKDAPKAQRGQTPNTDMYRGKLQQYSSVGTQPQQGSHGRSHTAQGTRAQHHGFEPGGISIESTDDAAAFFKQAGHLLSQQSAEHSMASARPPPAGMRGALSWGIGPNAFENDGRPGTRGGGTAFDLEGRPVTRSGMRAASRQASVPTGRPGTGQSGGLSYAAALTNPTAPASNSSLQNSIDLSSPSARAQSNARGPGAGGQADRWVADSPSSPTKNTRGAPQQPARCGSSQRAAASTRQQEPAANTTLAGRSSMFKVDEEGDVDAFLAGLSDDEGDATNMDDLKVYLSTLDQDRSPAPESSLTSKSSHSRSTAASTPSPSRSRGRAQAYGQWLIRQLYSRGMVQVRGHVSTC